MNLTEQEKASIVEELRRTTTMSHADAEQSVRFLEEALVRADAQRAADELRRQREMDLVRRRDALRNKYVVNRPKLLPLRATLHRWLGHQQVWHRSSMFHPQTFTRIICECGRTWDR